VFKKNKIDISFWYIATVIIMAVLYFLLSKKDFEGMITRYYLVPLGWILPVKYTWSILILAVLLICWVLIFISRDNKR